MKMKLGSSVPSRFSIISMSSEGLLSPSPSIANRRRARSGRESSKTLRSAESVVKMCARRTGEYEEEVRGPKKEEPQRQLLDAVFNLQPRIVLRRADVSENIHPELQQSVSSHIKEEEEGEEVQCIKEEEDVFRHMKEEEQEEIIQVPSTGVHLKSKYEGQSEERQGPELPSRNSSCDGDFCERSQTDGHDDEQSEGDLTCHSANQSWKCSQCSKAFATMRNFKRHVKIHTGEKPFRCSVCGQRFSRKGGLKRHTRTHTGEKPFSCSVCGQGFSQNVHLKSHKTTHTGDKPFSCSVCGQRFIQNGHLKKHTRTHTGEKPFSCSICGQTFSQKENLKSHTSTHTGERLFSCSVCGQRFTRKGLLKSHKRTHTGEKPFSCLVCDQGFTQKCHLKIHTRTHTGEKPFSCLVCDQRFSYKYQAQTHKCAVENSSDQECFNECVKI
ncbi:zinc finger protein 501-like isoform X1 [Syngnathoides biaculeatus]|uniref:zinc finger protein 501-like isoform X1 n=1 Tax=Syngnathoides biaculeatus TaxID=300417 RepID=UPI002ADE63F8|nr:zinc finger protein 501-like isoform X1 [Syngnathoides biaculeatus]